MVPVARGRAPGAAVQWEAMRDLSQALMTLTEDTCLF